MKITWGVLFTIGAMNLALTTAYGFSLGFDDLTAPPALDSRMDLLTTNGGTLDYGGVIWDSRVTVVGKNYRTDPTTPGPLFGLPESGDYFISQDTSASHYGDGITLTTSLVLTGAWFGRNEYYGFGGGADQITIYALSGATELGSVEFDLPLTNPGQPEPLSFVDTSIFLGYSGITGYRIDRFNPNLEPTSANWVADSFEFTAVPEPKATGILGIVAIGAVLARGALRRRNCMLLSRVAASS